MSANSSTSLSLAAECSTKNTKFPNTLTLILTSCSDRWVTAEMIDEAAGYKDGRIGWILSAVEMKRGTQEMETAVSRKFHLPLVAIVSILFIFAFSVMYDTQFKISCSLTKIRYKNCVQMVL